MKTVLAVNIMLYVMVCAWKLQKNKNVSELHQNYSHHSSTGKEIRSANYEENTNTELYGLNIKLCKENSCLKKSHDNCYCDDLCIHYGDCCADAIPFREFLNKTFYQSSVTKPSSVDYTLIRFARHSTCVTFQVNREQTSIQVVTKCPEDVDAEETSNCTKNIYELVSIGYGEGEQIVLKNKFCAFCHNLKSNSIRPWHKEMTCSGVHTNNGTNRCVKIVYLPYAKNTLRHCLQETFRSFSSPKCSLHEMCMLYVDTVDYVDDTELTYVHYKNPHCAVCDRETLNKTDDPRLECPDRKFGAGSSLYPTESLLPGSANLNELFSLNVFNLWIDPPKPTPCNGFQVYDYDNRNCKTVCPHGYKEEGSTCQRISRGPGHGAVGTSATNLTIIAQTNKLPQSVGISSTCKDIQNILDVLFVRDIVSFSGTTYENATNTHFCNYYTLLHNMSEISTLLSRIETNMTAFPIPMNLSVTNLDNSSFNCNENKTQLSTINDTLVNVSDRLFAPFPEPKISVNLTGNLHRLVYSVDNDRSNLESFVYCIDIKPQGGSNISPRDLNCSREMYGPEDFVYTEDNTSVFIITENRPLKLNEPFEIVENNLIVCIEEKMTRRLKWKYVLENYLTIVTSTMSMIALAILIVVHIVFRELRNFHGKCMICFFASLLIAHMSLIIGDLYLYKFEILCKISARLEHYAWLCVFAWNSLLAYDVAQRFNVCLSIKRKLNINNNSRFAKFTLIGWIAPFLFMCCINIVDWSRFGNFLGYGQNNKCWLTKINGKLIAYVIPVGVMLLFSVVCFCVSLHGIEYNKRIKFLTKNVKRDRNRCIIYTKISVILGISWILAYVSSWVDLDLLEYLNIIVNGLQGLLLLASFLINSRVLQCKIDAAVKKEYTNDRRPCY